MSLTRLAESTRDLSVVDPSDDTLRLTRVTAGEVLYPPGGRLGPRWQHDLQLLLLHSGSATIHVDGIARPAIGPGFADLLLPFHRVEIAFATTQPTRHAWVAGGLTDPAPALMAKIASPSAISASPALTVLVGEAVAAARKPLSTRSPLLSALATAVFWRYIGDAEAGSQHPGGATVTRARVYIDAHTGDPDLDLRQVAAAVEVTAPHLVRRFRAELGTTPMAYLWERRIAAGTDLLVHTGLPIGEVAERTGFKSVYHFSRKIRESTGRAPTEFRKLRWKES